MYQAVCFDLDGTLFDDRQYVRAGLHSAANELKQNPGVDLYDQFLEAYFDRGITERTFDVVLEERGMSQSHVPQLVNAYHENSGELTPFPGTKETLETLQEEYDLGVITGGRNGEEKLERLGLRSYFDSVIVTSDEDWSKRDPDPFELFLKRIDALPTEIVCVGDRPELDFRHPNDMGMYTVRVHQGRFATVVCTEKTSPDECISSVTELPELISDLD